MDFNLSDHTIDVQYVLTCDAGDEAYISLLAQLPPEERSRAEQFMLLNDRVAFAAGRVLVRRMLSSYFGTPTPDWRFLLNSHGKPEVARLSGSPDVRFNLSHSAGIVVAACSLERDIGIDVENTWNQLDFLEVARSQFSKREIATLESLSGEAQRDAFFALWTLKEAYTKAIGTGLSRSLADFSFSLDPPTISFSVDGGDDPEHWFFRSTNLPPAYLLAIAARRRPEEELICRLSQVDLARLLSPDLGQF
jgi:4'-phosphopantetheinyl transferase